MSTSHTQTSSAQEDILPSFLYSLIHSFYSKHANETLSTFTTAFYPRSMRWFGQNVAFSIQNAKKKDRKKCVVNSYISEGHTMLVGRGYFQIMPVTLGSSDWHLFTFFSLKRRWIGQDFRVTADRLSATSKISFFTLTSNLSHSNYQTVINYL